MKINKVLNVFVIISMVLILLIGAVRLLTTPGFAAFEYKRFWFPSDPYGMGKKDRLRWSGYAIQYLTNDEDISYLGDLKFEDGKAVFNERELSHMADVKKVMKTSFTVWYGLIGFFIAAMIWFAVMGEWKTFVLGITWGAWLMIGLIIAIMVSLIVSFNRLFEQFHKLFFKDGTWLFYQSDTLIRLFPIEFWRDAFIFVGAFCLIVAALVLVIKLLVNRYQKKKLLAS